MATKKQIEKLAQKAGCEFSVDSISVALAAPKGFCFSDDTYGRHYSEWPVGEDYTKQEAYDCCYEILSSGIEKCDCDECNLIAKSA